MKIKFKRTLDIFGIRIPKSILIYLELQHHPNVDEDKINQLCSKNLFDLNKILNYKSTKLELN